MRVIAALIAIGAAISVAGAAPEAKKRAYRAVVYFKGPKTDSTGTYSEIVLKPRSSAAAPVRLHGKPLDPKLKGAYLEIDFETASECSLGCDATLLAFHDVVNPMDVRNHPLRGSPKPLPDPTN